jgi:hypothetical protein
MRDSIVEKLRAVLSAGVDDECKVVYVLAESRKLIDKYPPDPPPFALKLYCHWALHVDLSHKRTTLPFLERVDAFAAGVLSGNANLIDEHHMFREFIFLDTFRKELRLFLRDYDLPMTVCDEESRWREFLRNYAGIIEDGTLSCSADSPSLSVVREVVFNKGAPTTAGSYLPFYLSWDIHLLDGRTMTVEVDAEEVEGGQAIAHGIHLN